mgnify:CR=1 FL=1
MTWAEYAAMELARLNRRAEVMAEADKWRAALKEAERLAQASRASCWMRVR